MAKRSNKKTSPEDGADNSTSSLTEVVITKEHAKAIQSLIYSQQRIKLDQEAYAEDIKAVAQKMNIKPGEVKEMVSWIVQEQEKGGVISAKEKKIDVARQLLSFFDGASSSDNQDD